MDKQTDTQTDGHTILFLLLLRGTSQFCHLYQDDVVLLSSLGLCPRDEVGSHGVVSTTVTQRVPEDVEAEAWGTSLCLRGGGR